MSARSSGEGVSQQRGQHYLAPHRQDLAIPPLQLQLTPESEMRPLATTY